MTLMQAQPAALESRAEAYLRSADAILAAAEELDRLVFEQQSLATDAVDARSRELSSGIRTAHQRYTGTSSAIRTFAVEVRALQQQHEQAQADVQLAGRQEERAEYEVAQLRREIRIREENDAPAQLIRSLEQELYGWQSRERSADATSAQAAERMRIAEQRFEEAAGRAISAIDTAIAAGADTLIDRVVDFASHVAEAFGNIRRWIEGVVKTVIDAIDRFIDAVMPFVILGLAIAAGIGLLVQLGLRLGPFGPFVIVLGSAALLAGASVLIGRALSDVLAPDPKISKLDAGVADPRPKQISDVFTEAGEVDHQSLDAEGLAYRSVVKIDRIVAPDGSVSYRVILPSTQDWQALAPFMSEEELSTMQKLQGVMGGIAHDPGATNDVDSNIALMIFPGLRTQYERAVLAAMEDAGIRPGPDGDPVMLVGFSQGGIMAGHLAANRSDAFNFQAIMVAGAPIDHMNIPAKTTVISLQHEGDPVPKLDIAVRPDESAAKQTPNWLTITDRAPGDPSDVGQIHNSGQYNTTLDAHLTDVLTFDPDLLDFFPVDGAEATSTSYEWHE